MRAVDHIQPFIPAHRVQKPGQKEKRRDPGTGQAGRPQPKIRPDQKSDPDRHVVDEFA